MSTLNQRVARLEVDSPDNATIVRIVSFVDGIGTPVRIARVNGEGEWIRLPDETAEAFRERATLGPHDPGRGGIVVLREHNGEAGAQNQ